METDLDDIYDAGRIPMPHMEAMERFSPQQCRLTQEELQFNADEDVRMTRFIEQRYGSIALAQKHVHDQEEWIRDHGATLEGYIERYGTIEDPKYGTMGGPAIYAADTLYLYLLTNQLRDELRRIRRK